MTSLTTLLVSNFKPIPKQNGRNEQHNNSDIIHSSYNIDDDDAGGGTSSSLTYICSLPLTNHHHHISQLFVGLPLKTRHLFSHSQCLSPTANSHHQLVVRSLRTTNSQIQKQKKSRLPI